MNAQEIRRAERRSADQPSTLRGRGSEPHDSWVHDVSSTGMRIECRANLAIGDEVTVGLAGAGATVARVVWRRGNEYGCAFAEPLSAEAAASAFNGSPVVQLHPLATSRQAALALNELETSLLRMIEEQPTRGRFWFAGLGAATLAIAAPAALLLAHLLH